EDSLCLPWVSENLPLDDLLRAGLRLLPVSVPSRGSRHLSGLLHSVHRLLQRRSLRHLLLDGLSLAGLSGQVRKLKTARLHQKRRLLLDDFEHVSPVLVKVLVLGLERVDLPLEVLPKLGLHVILVHGAKKLSQPLTNRLALLLKDPPRHTLRKLLHDLRPFGFQLVQELVRAHGGFRLSELLCRMLCDGLLIALHRLHLLEIGQELLVLLLQRTKLLALLPELALKFLVTALQVLRGLVLACPQLLPRVSLLLCLHIRVRVSLIGAVLRLCVHSLRGLVRLSLGRMWGVSRLGDPSNVLIAQAENVLHVVRHVSPP